VDAPKLGQPCAEVPEDPLPQHLQEFIQELGVLPEELSDGFPVQQTPNVILGSADVFGPAASLARQNFFLKINMHDTEKYVRGAEGGGEMKRSFWEAVFAFGGGALAGLADRILTNYHEGRAIAEPDETKMLLA